MSDELLHLGSQPGLWRRGDLRPKILTRLDSPLVPLALVAAVYLASLGARLAVHGWDPSAFVLAGDRGADTRQVPPSLHAVIGSAGYDGQFYYRLALDPFTDTRTSFGITLDAPSYRQQRIGYPVVAWGLSLGRPDLVPYALILANYLALCLIGWLSGAYARSLGQHALWGLVLALYPGYLLTLARDLTEAQEVALLLAGLLLARQRRDVPAAVLLTAAVLTRETAVLAVVGVAIARLVESREGRGVPLARWATAAVPVAALGAWELYLLVRWGKLALVEGGGNLGPPFAGLFGFVARVAAMRGFVAAMILVEAAYLVVLVAVAALSLARTADLVPEKASWLLYAGLASLLTGAVWVEDWAFLRALAELGAVGGVLTVGRPGKLRWLALLATLATFAVVFITAALIYDRGLAFSHAAVPR